ncbi:MAG: hypothetical protein HWN80_19115 [Candidatus Lokiarchaeota archaeon]|nr:hypothetical protein [Candidatus Lokiarchaeota archaeon]
MDFYIGDDCNPSDPSKEKYPPSIGGDSYLDNQDVLRTFMINYLFGGAFAITASYLALRALMAKIKKGMMDHLGGFEAVIAITYPFIL